MNKNRVRICALLLVPCLGVDPSTASSLHIGLSNRTHGLDAQRVFNDQAIPGAISSARFLGRLGNLNHSAVGVVIAGLASLLGVPVFSMAVQGKGGNLPRLYHTVYSPFDQLKAAYLQLPDADLLRDHVRTVILEMHRGRTPTQERINLAAPLMKEIMAWGEVVSTYKSHPVAGKWVETAMRTLEGVFTTPASVKPPDIDSASALPRAKAPAIHTGDGLPRDYVESSLESLGAWRTLLWRLQTALISQSPAEVRSIARDNIPNAPEPFNLHLQLLADDLDAGELAWRLELTNRAIREKQKKGSIDVLTHPVAMIAAVGLSVLHWIGEHGNLPSFPVALSLPGLIVEMLILAGMAGLLAITLRHWRPVVLDFLERLGVLPYVPGYPWYARSAQLRDLYSDASNYLHTPPDLARGEDRRVDFAEYLYGKALRKPYMRKNFLEALKGIFIYTSRMRFRPLGDTVLEAHANNIRQDRHLNEMEYRIVRLALGLPEKDSSTDPDSDLTPPSGQGPTKRGAFMMAAVNTRVSEFWRSLLPPSARHPSLLQAT